MSIGRNAPCPCLSGKKYKKCCGVNGAFTATNGIPLLDFSKIPQKNIDWPTYQYDLGQTMSSHDFEWTDEGIYYSGKNTVVYIPSELNGISVTAIAPKGFSGSSVHEVYLPPNLEEIGNQAFDGCQFLTKILFPPKLKRIGRYAFQGCESLETIFLYDGIEEIDGYAFDECTQLRAARLPERMRNIGAYAFSNTALEQIMLPAGVKFLGNSIFYNCRQLERVIFQEGLEQIGIMAFMDCNRLQAVHLPNSLQVIRTGAFQGCSSLQEVLVQEKIRAIDDSAFVGCTGIQRLIVPFRTDIQVELFNPLNDFPFSVGTSPESQPKRNVFLGAVILNEPIKRNHQVDWTFMEQTQAYTDALLQEANQQYGLQQSFREHEATTLLAPKPERAANDDSTDLEVFEIGELMAVESEVPEQTQVMDRYVGLLSQGMTFKHKGDFDGAQASYIEAIKLKPKEYTAYYNLGKILYIQKDFEASVRSYQTALELGCNSPNTFLHLGHALLDATHKDGRYKLPIQEYEEALNPQALVQRLLAGGKMLAPTYQKVEEYNSLCTHEAETYIRLRVVADAD